MPDRQYSAIDRWLIRADRRLRAMAPPPPASTRPNPARTTEDGELDARARRHAAGLMRVNHAGEVAAQALYRGQASTARDPETRVHLLAAAAEESDHLHWCEQRLRELDDRPSRLSPAWYVGSWLIGALAGTAGDRWSLGFVAETEKQVGEHLAGHLEALPEADRRSRAIVTAMHADETRHGAEAVAAGGQPLPPPIPRLMRWTARIMKFGAYRL